VISKQVGVFNARNNSEIEAVVADLVQKRSEAIVVAPAQVFFNNRVQLITLLTRHRLAAIFPERGYVEAGGLSRCDSEPLTDFPIVLAAPELQLT
jgi:hypothetical protein